MNKFNQGDYIINSNYTIYSATIYLIKDVQLNKHQYVLYRLGFYMSNFNTISLYDNRHIIKAGFYFSDVIYILLPEHLLKQLNKLLIFQ